MHCILININIQTFSASETITFCREIPFKRIVSLSFDSGELISYNAMDNSETT